VTTNTRTKKTTEIKLSNQDIIDLLIKTKAINKKEFKEGEVKFAAHSVDTATGASSISVFEISVDNPIWVTIISES